PAAPRRTGAGFTRRAASACAWPIFVNSVVENLSDLGGTWAGNSPTAGQEDYGGRRPSARAATRPAAPAPPPARCRAGGATPYSKRERRAARPGVVVEGCRTRLADPPTRPRRSHVAPRTDPRLNPSRDGQRPLQAPLPEPGLAGARRGRRPP